VLNMCVLDNLGQEGKQAMPYRFMVHPPPRGSALGVRGSSVFLHPLVLYSNVVAVLSSLLSQTIQGRRCLSAFLDRAFLVFFTFVCPIHQQTC
jgi:hypothetical protein